VTNTAHSSGFSVLFGLSKVWSPGIGAYFWVKSISSAPKSHLSTWDNPKGIQMVIQEHSVVQTKL